MTLPEFQKRMAALNDVAQNGCRDSGCRIKKPTGMATNGGCRCSPLDFADELSDLAEAVTMLGRRNWAPVLSDEDFLASRPKDPVGYDDGSKAHDDYCVADCAWQDEAVERGIAFEP